MRFLALIPDLHLSGDRARKGRDLRLAAIAVTAAALVSGCAAEPRSDRAAPSAGEPAGQTSDVADLNLTPEQERSFEQELMNRMGYTRKNIDGKIYYCKRQVALGSRLNPPNTCMPYHVLMQRMYDAQTAVRQKVINALKDPAATRDGG